MRPAPMLALAAAVLISVVAAHPCNRDTTVKVHMEQPHSLPGYAQVWRMRTETAEIAGFSNVTGHISECWRAGAPYGPKDVPCGQQGVQQCGVDEHSASKSCLEKPDCEAFMLSPAPSHHAHNNRSSTGTTSGNVSLGRCVIFVSKTYQTGCQTREGGNHDSCLQVRGPVSGSADARGSTGGWKEWDKKELSSLFKGRQGIFSQWLTFEKKEWDTGWSMKDQFCGLGPGTLSVEFKGIKSGEQKKREVDGMPRDDTRSLSLAMKVSVLASNPITLYPPVALDLSAFKENMKNSWVSLSEDALVVTVSGKHDNPGVRITYGPVVAGAAYTVRITGQKESKGKVGLWVRCHGDGTNLIGLDANMNQQRGAVLAEGNPSVGLPPDVEGSVTYSLVVPGKRSSIKLRTPCTTVDIGVLFSDVHDPYSHGDRFSLTSAQLIRQPTYESNEIQPTYGYEQ